MAAPVVGARAAIHRSAGRSLLALYVGVHYGSFAAAGSDSYGYVSQARLWLNGTPRVAAAVGA